MGAMAFRCNAHRAHGALLRALNLSLAHQKNTRAPNDTPRPGSGATSFRNDVCTRASSSSRLLPSRKISQALRSEEHTSELQSLMRISYAVFCLKKKKTTT